MTILFTEYKSRFEILGEGLQVVIILGIFGIIITLVSVFAYEYSVCNTKKAVTSIIILAVIIAGMIVSIIKLREKTSYINYQEVLIEDDTVPLDIMQNFEIREQRGEIYVIAPKDGKLIKE